VVLLIGLTALWLALPSLITHYAMNAVHQQCPHCELQMANPTLSLLHPSHIQMNFFHIIIGDENTLQADVSFHRFSFDLDLREAMRKKYRLENASLDFIWVKITDGDKDDGKKSKGSGGELPDLQIPRLDITRGTFVYLRVLKGVVSTLDATEIHGPVKNISLADSTTPITAELQSKFQNSGPHLLKLSLKPFAEPAIVDVDLTVHHQDMEGLTKFLMPNDGVELHGELVEGNGFTHMVGRHLHSEVWAEYKDLKVKVHKADDRSPLAAFFTTLGTKLTSKKQNLDTDQENQSRGVAIDREADESVVHFLLRGWKEAAIKVSTAPKHKKPDQ